MERCVGKSKGQVRSGKNLGNEEVVKNCSRFKIIHMGLTVVLNEMPLHDSMTSDSSLDSSMNQDSLIQRESRPIRRKATKTKRGSNSTNETATILEQIALNRTMRIERDMKRYVDEKARERECEDENLI
ncbi:unnamed protein product [Prunus brigantina]